MKFYTTVLAALSVCSTIAAPVEQRGVQVGLLNSILSTMQTTLAQNQQTGNDLIYQARVTGANELLLAAQMVDQLGSAAGTFTDGGAQIASSLASAGKQLAAPAITTFTTDFKTAMSIFSSSLAYFQQEAAAAGSAFAASTSATVQQEAKAAESALQPFINPMLAYAKQIQSDGSASGAAALTGLQTVVAGGQVLASGLNDILGISTD